MKRLLLFYTIYLMIEYLCCAEGLCTISNQGIQIELVNGKYCLHNDSNERLSSFYDSIDPFWDNVSIVSNDGSFGLISIDGYEILPCKYVGIFRADDCFIIEEKNDYGLCYGLCDLKGNLLISPYYHEMDYSNGQAVVTINGPDGGAGIVDREGEIVIPLIFERIAPFQSGWAWVVEKETFQTNFVNEKNEFLLDDSPDACDGFFDDYALIRYDKDNYIINSDKSIFKKLEGKPISYIYNNMFLVEKKEKKYIYFALNDEYVDLGLKEIDERGYRNGLIAVQDDTGKWGFMNEEFEIVIPCLYDSVQSFSENRTWAKIDQDYYFLDTTGKCYYIDNLEKASPLSDGLAAIKKNNRWGFIDINGELMLFPSLVSNEDSLQFNNGYCDLLISDPFAALYIDKEFNVFSQYDLWDIIFD